MVTRTSFCKSCFQKGRPTHDDVYLLYCGTKQGYRVDTNRQVRGKRGYVPTLFSKVGKVKNGIVTVKKRCGMNGCGVDIYPEEDGGYTFYTLHESIIHMKLKDYNALVTKCSDLGYDIY